MVRCLVVDDVATWLPEGFPGSDHPRGLTLKLEGHLAFEHVTEDRPGVPVRPGTGISGRQFDGCGHYVGRRWDSRRLLREQHGQGAGRSGRHRGISSLMVAYCAA
jgi:hypothetical protein